MLRMPSKNDRVLMLIALMATASLAVGGLVYAMSSSDAAELETSAARIAELNALATRAPSTSGGEPVVAKVQASRPKAS